MENRYCDLRHVDTNIGLVPLEDYLEIIACQNGFDSYQDLKAAGLHVKVKPVLVDSSEIN